MRIQGQFLLIIVHSLWIVTRVENNVRQLPLKTSVVDPISLHPDPDLSFHVNLDPVPDPALGFCWPKIEKNLLKKCILFWSKTTIYCTLLYLLLKGCPSYRSSLQPSKENIQHFKNEICKLFLFLWVFFALLDPTNPDPDPQHCKKQYFTN